MGLGHPFTLLQILYHNEIMSKAFLLLLKHQTKSFLCLKLYYCDWKVEQSISL